LRLAATTVIARRSYAVGAPHGLRRLDPLFVVIGDEVNVQITIDLPVRKP
jgi:hypothetical protein